jgi:hypothetical protein
MPVTPTSSPALSAPPPTDLPAGESNRRTMPTTDSAQETLTRLIRSAQEAALNPAALEKLVRAILDTEQVHAGADLAMLLRPMVRDANTQRTDSTSALPLSLPDFAATYLREHPTENVRAFFLPFLQLVQRDIEIPDDIELAFSRGILPFETFRDLVAVYVNQLPVCEPEHLHFGFTAHVWKDATYWEHSLAAICSPITMALLDGGAITPETLLDWIGMTARVQSVASGYAPQADASHAPSEYSHPVALLLADWSIANFYDQPVRNAALLRHPEKLRALADNLVPFKHIEYLLSVADTVDARTLETEMDRVIKAYAPSDTSNETPLQRAFFYSYRFRTNMTPEQNKRLDESRRNLAPHVLRHRLRTDGLLDPRLLLDQPGTDQRPDTLTLTRPPDGGANASPHLPALPARALFEKWTALGIPAEQQTWIGWLMARGFDENLARDLAQAHAADPSRLQAWFDHDDQANLGLWLDGAMKTAVPRWLADTTIPPETLALLPAMIQSDMSVDQIDRILNTEVSSQRAKAVFGPWADTPRQVWYGLVTPDQLCDRITQGDESENELRETAQQELRDMSELRKQAADTRDRLRHLRRAMENLRADMPAGTPHERQCARFAAAWQGAITVLDDLLQPSLETRLAQNPEEIADRLRAMSADLAFQITDKEEHQGIPASTLLA